MLSNESAFSTVNVFLEGEWDLARNITYLSNTDFDETLHVYSSGKKYLCVFSDSSS